MRRRRPGRHTERRAQIVEAAMRILAERGSRGFTAQVLADEVGVTGGALYRHFPGLEAVADAVVDRMEAMLFEGFPPEAEEPIERLGLFFRQRARTIAGNPFLSRLLLGDQLRQAAGPAHARRVDDLKRRTRDFVAGCVREAGGAGLLAPGVAPEAAVLLTIGSVLALAHAGGDGLRLERLAEEVWAALERTLRAAPSPARPERVARRARA